MPELKTGFLKGNAARILTAVLIVQAAVTYGFARKEVIVPHQELATAPEAFGSWQMVSQREIEKEVLDVLKADDTLSRSYSDGARLASLFVAYFKSQRTGQAPHSPKNCLPGSGWVPSASGEVEVNVPGWPRPISVNRYVVARGDQKSLVMYWYQSRDRVVADEYSAKFYVVADAMRYNRTDTALVRVIVPVTGDNVEAADSAAQDFIKAMFVPLRAHFPAA